jgi:hypothetical protein
MTGQTQAGPLLCQRGVLIMLVPVFWIGLGATAIYYQHPLLALLACAPVPFVYGRLQRLGWMTLWHKFWKRFREQRSQLDKAAEMRSDQRERRRTIRVVRSATALASGLREQPPHIVLAGCLPGRFYGKRWFYAPVEESNRSAKHHYDLDWLHDALVAYPYLGWWQRLKADRVIVGVVKHRAAAGRLIDLVEAQSEVIRLYVGSFASGIYENGQCALADLSLSVLGDYSDEPRRVIYRLPMLALLERSYEQVQSFFEGLLGTSVVLGAGDVAGSVQVLARLRIDGEINLSSDKLVAFPVEDVVLGVDLDTRGIVTIDVSRAYSTLMVGATRSGKTTVVNLIVWQLLQKPKEIVCRLFLCDLKSVGFKKFIHDGRVTRARTLDETVRIIHWLAEVELERRKALCDRHGVEKYPGPRIFLVIDEAAVLQDFDGTKDECRKLSANLKMLARQGAGLGVIIVSTTQRGSSDEIEGSVKNNLENILFFKVPHRSTSGATLGPAEELPIDVRALGRGECMFRTPGEPDRVVHIYMCQAARDDLAAIAAAKAEIATLPDIDIGR